METGSSAITALPGETEVAEQTGSEQQGQTTGEAIEISDTYKIALLTEKPDTELPENYVDTELTLNGKSYPVWQDENKSSYYIVYAENSDGEKQLYQYDSKEGPEIYCAGDKKRQRIGNQREDQRCVGRTSDAGSYRSGCGCRIPSSDGVDSCN